jgi:ArsR family transcriptional regulator
MKTPRSLRERERFFLALADATRLRILNLLSRGEVCVAHFSEVLGESQPKVSRHLAYLRGAGLVSTRRDGKWIFYKLDWPASDGLAVVLSGLLNSLKEDPAVSAERLRLDDLVRTGDLKTEKGRRKKTYKERRAKVIEKVEGGKPVQRIEREIPKEDDLDTFLL